MKKMKRRNQRNRRNPVLFSFGFLFLVIAATSAASVSVFAEPESPAVVSPALYVLAEENSMAMAGLKGGSIEFEADDFARAVNLSKVESITVTKAPPITDGELRVGGTVVTGGQTVSGANLSLMSYTAKNESLTTSSFRFRVGDSPLELTCKLYLLDKVNYSPTLSMVPKTSLEVSTHRNITLYGTLPCHDPDGDETIIEIVSYPETGLLRLTDRTTGAYTFTPGENYTGKDSFTYVARDLYGNYSAAATVSLTVMKPTTSVVYADMEDSPSYNAALTMTEAGVMSGTQVGSNTYFYPTRTVSRGEFTVMAMHTLGISEVADAERTVFADDKDIPSGIKGYIATAYELGYIQGEINENGQRCFYPNREITRAEAAVMIGNMINAATPTATPSFSDSAEIPAWAASSLYSLNSMGIMTAADGSIEPSATVTRGDAAEILSALLVTLE
ncbi:MAG: hypothetical protein E7668_01565 [Ruminococcaceae bacterium]|nr:hypothetical protein [Oscillospiraceae bacterium]